jgi:hypothetical protein
MVKTNKGLQLAAAAESAWVVVLAHSTLQPAPLMVAVAATPTLCNEKHQ